MQTLTLKSLKTETHPQTKMLFWYLFLRSRGGQNRVRIISLLRNKPSNKHQLSKDLELEYKGVQHHIKILEKNNLITKMGENYGVTYFVSQLFEENQAVFDEILARLEKSVDKRW